MKSMSNVKMPQTGQTRGKKIFRYNYQEVMVKDDVSDEEKSAWKFDFVLVDKLDRSAIIDAIIATEYSKSDELALINNKDLTRDGAHEYSKYQAFRAQAKAWADELN
jgi:hypothetical protein